MSTPIHQPDDFGQFLREAIGSLGMTVEGVRVEYGISLQKNVLGQERVTREKLDRLLAALPFDAGTKADIESRYEGQAKDTIESVVIAGIRRHTQETFAKKAGVSVSALTYILHGDPRRREGSDVHDVKWQTWQKIANAMNMHELDQHLVWRKNAKDVLAAEGQKDPLGLEIDLLLARRPEATLQNWRKERPASFQEMSIRGFQAFIRSMRAGELQSWEQVSALLKDLGADAIEAVGIAAAWVTKAQQLQKKEAAELGLVTAKNFLMAERLKLLKAINDRRPKTERTISRPSAASRPDPDEPEHDGEDEDDATGVIERDDAWDDEEAADYGGIFVDRD